MFTFLWSASSPLLDKWRFSPVSSKTRTYSMVAAKMKAKDTIK